MDVERLSERLRKNLAYELWLTDLYNGYVRKTKDEKIRANLSILTKEAIGHATCFRHLIHRAHMESTDEKLLIKKDEFADFLKVGLQEEFHARKIYERQLRTMPGYVRKQLKQIISDEKRHARIVEKMIAELEKKTNF